jgi:hypothetical protein
MTSKAVIAVAVASAFASPFAASANSNMQSDGRYDATTAQSQREHFMRRGERVSANVTGTWEVATPYSPDENGSVTPPSNARSEEMNGPQNERLSSIDVTEVITPFSPNETGSVAVEQRRPQDRSLAMVRSLPNPQTPASPNESDAWRTVDDAIAYQEQIAEIDQVHMAAASATGTTSGVSEERAVGRIEPVTPASPTTLNEPQPDMRSEVAPSETPASPGEQSFAAANQPVVPESQPVHPQSEHSAGLVSPTRRTLDGLPADTQSEPLVPEAGVATPPSPPSQGAANESENGGSASPAATM